MSFSRKLMWNVYSGGIAAVTALVAHKVVNSVWTTVTGADTPDPNDPAIPGREAIAWALASGIGIGMAQLVVNRFAAQRWEAFTGEHVPSTRPVTVML